MVAVSTKYVYGDGIGPNTVLYIDICTKVLIRGLSFLADHSLHYEPYLGS
jgi:hypothetical protein